MQPNQTVLFAITGVSPAVVTETLYAIEDQGLEWPSSIRIVTTAVGKKLAVEGLLEQGHLQALCTALGRPAIPFSPDDIRVVKNGQGEDLDDARSREDHEHLANFIMREIRDLTSDASTRIHASISGGRKTMSFYLGYAVCLFGRYFDKLTHVLVSDGYEQCKDFYYPTRESKIVINRINGQQLDAKEATLTLADIPFIRQRNLVPEIVKDNNTAIDFRNLVDLVNLGHQPEAIEIRVQKRSRCLSVFNKADQTRAIASVKFESPLYWSFYLMILKDASQGYADPCARPRSGEHDTFMASDVLLILSEEVLDIPLKGGNSEQLVDELINEDLVPDELAGNLNRQLRSIRQGIKADLFSTYVQSIKENLAATLPYNLVDVLSPSPIIDDGEELTMQTKHAEPMPPKHSTRGKTKRGQGKAYGIALPSPTTQIVFLTEE